MPWSTHSKNGMLNGLRNVAWQKTGVWASLHTASPGDTGINEVTGGSPAYARKQLTFAVAASGSMATTAPVVFDVPAGTVAWVGLWDAVSGGNFLGSHDVVDEVFAAQGTHTINTGSTLDLNS